MKGTLSGSRPAWVREKKNEKSVRSLGNMEENKRRMKQINGKFKRRGKKTVRNEILFYSHGK